MNRTALACTAIASLALLASAALFAPRVTAGPLSPPVGPVASTYKTLAEVEPRIAINATNTPGDPLADPTPSTYKITAPGSYYLASNVTGESGKIGIEITASGVSIDLNGFDLTGVPGSLDGIATTVANLRALSISNGSVLSWGSEGIDVNTLIVEGATIDNVRAANNAGSGIRAGRGGLIARCTSTGNTLDGFVIGSGNAMSECAAFSNGGSGITTNSVESVISNCAARLNGLNGIAVAGGCVVLNCVAGSNGQAPATGANILAANGDNRIEGNTCTSADRGIEVTGNGNLILRNACSGNITNYAIAANNIYGPIIDRQGLVSTAVSGSSAASVLGTTDPWANFTY